jgi:hypothetical protein
LVQKIERANVDRANEELVDLETELAKLEEKQANFEDTWNMMWDERHENFVMCNINRRAHNEEIPPEDVS